jgi:hypothetical protein
MDSNLLLLTVLALAQEEPQSPFIVRIVEPAGDPFGLAEVMIGALGLSGALGLLAVVAGIVLAGGLFLLRRRHPLQ